MKTILITGCAGFIGFHLATSLLEKKYRVIGVDNLNDYYSRILKKDRLKILKKHRNFVFHRVDISNEEKVNTLFSNYKIDKVCHLAAQAGVRYSLENPLQYIDSNIRGFVIVLECMRKHNVKNIVYASSSSVYGDREIDSGFAEKDRCDSPASLYAVTKRTDELIAYVYHSLYSFRCTGIRFFSVYGPWGRPDMAYFSFTKAILEGKIIRVFNFGKSKRDFTYIDDVIPSLVLSVEKMLPWDIINLGHSMPVTVLKMIEILEKELGKKARVKLISKQPGDVLVTYADIGHARKILGYRPDISIGEGLRLFVNWYKEYYVKNATDN